jgi:predicted DsbA family dithiol-disulfide isomerase
VRWLPFQLNPQLPASGMSRREYIEQKWGPGKGPEVYSRVAGVGAAVGVPFAFDKIVVQPNTLEAHRLLGYADEKGRQDEMAEELFKAYFLEGVDLTNLEALADAAGRAGLDREASLSFLKSGEGREKIAEADVEARSAGIGGVPFFIFNRRVGVSGAQEVDVLLQAMEQSQRTEEAR